MKRIGVKFCGGCNPNYERGQYWESVKEAAADEVTWVGADHPDPDTMLVICGCPTACPEKAANPADFSQLIVIRDGRPTPEGIVKEIREHKVN